MHISTFTLDRRGLSCRRRIRHVVVGPKKAVFAANVSSPKRPPTGGAFRGKRSHQELRGGEKVTAFLRRNKVSGAGAQNRAAQRCEGADLALRIGQAIRAAVERLVL